MYYRLNEEGGILDFSRTKYHEDCLYTDLSISVAWDGLAYIEGTAPEEPAEVVQERLQSDFTNAIQAYLDFEAQKLGYDNCHSVCTYIDTGVAKFDAEGAAFRKWRSLVWDKCYVILASVKAGERPIPTHEELIAEMPKLVIVYGQ